MPDGFSGSAMVPPACRVSGLMAVSVRFPKLPTSTSAGVAAMVCGPGPASDGRAGLQGGDVDRRDRVAAVVGDERGSGARRRHRDGDRHRLRPHGNGRTGPPGPEVDRSHGVRIEVRHERHALAAGATGGHRHGVGLHSRPDFVQHLVGGRVDLVAASRHPGPRPAGPCRRACRPAQRAGCPPTPRDRRAGGPGRPASRRCRAESPRHPWRPRRRRPRPCSPRSWRTPPRPGPARRAREQGPNAVAP